MSITIQNRLLIIPGNKVMVPGCEPLTSPSTALAANIKCTTVAVNLDDALKAIPGSYVLAFPNPRVLYFVIPSGPPPTPDTCKNCNSGVQDWYQMLRDIGSPVQSEDEAILEQNCQNNSNIDISLH